MIRIRPWAMLQLRGVLVRGAVVLVLVVAFITGWGCSSPTPMGGGCQKDSDCKGDRLCSLGVCVDPAVTPSSRVDATIAADIAATGTDIPGTSDTFAAELDGGLGDTKAEAVVDAGIADVQADVLPPPKGDDIATVADGAVADSPFDACQDSCVLNEKSTCTTNCGAIGTKVCGTGCSWTACTPPAEVCNGKDDNCNSQTDEGSPDTDKDGIADCVDPDVDNDGVANGLDCAPTNPKVSSGAAESCNGVDDNCNGKTDEGFSDSDADGQADCADADADNDGVPNQVDCSPTDATVSPKVPEICDGLDNNCNSATDEGFQCKPGLAEACKLSCGATGTRSCSATCAWSACQPPQEACNGIDENCDGVTDEGFDCLPGKLTACTTTCGTAGSKVCSGKCMWGPCLPPGETCNGIDDNCDGQIDETFGYSLKTQKLTWTQPYSCSEYWAPIALATGSTLTAAAWQFLGNGYQLWAGGIDAAGDPVGKPWSPSTGPIDYDSIAALWTGSVIAFAWNPSSSQKGDLMTAVKSDTKGLVFGKLTTTSSLDNNYQRVGLATNGNNVMAVWSDIRDGIPSEVYATLATLDLQKVGKDIRVTTTAPTSRYAAVRWLAGRYVVTWTECVTGVGGGCKSYGIATFDAAGAPLVEQTFVNWNELIGGPVAVAAAGWLVFAVPGDDNQVHLWTADPVTVKTIASKAVVMCKKCQPNSPAAGTAGTNGVQIFAAGLGSDIFVLAGASLGRFHVTAGGELIALQPIADLSPWVGQLPSLATFEGSVRVLWTTSPSGNCELRTAILGCQ